MRASFLAALAVLAFQAGCDRPAQSVSAPAASTEPAPAPNPAAPAPTIAVPVGKFDAISSTAMGITGDLVAGNGDFVFSQGQAYGLAGAGEAKGADPYAATGGSFASLINMPGDGALKVFRVTREDPAKARNGGLCGADRATFIVTHEGVDSSGAPALFLLAFKGAAPPSAASPETELCGTFMYAPAAGEAATK